MKQRWMVDRSHWVEVERTDEGRLLVRWDGRVVHLASAGAERDARIALEDGRELQLLLGSDGAVLGPLVTGSARSVGHCAQCGSGLGPGVRFCTYCGRPTTEALGLEYVARIARAQWALQRVPVVLVVAGLVLLYQMGEAVEAGLDLVRSEASRALYPGSIDSRYTVGEMRVMLTWAPRSAMLVQWMMAGIAYWLSRWMKSAPLAAAIMACALAFVASIHNLTLGFGARVVGLVVDLFLLVLLLFCWRAASGIRALQQGRS